MVITRIVAGKADPTKANIYIDEKFAFSLPAEAVYAYGLKKGVEITYERFEELSKQKETLKAKSKALDYLSRRPHSEKELRQKLSKKGISDEAVDDSLEYLKDKGYQSDEEYARALNEKGQRALWSNRRIMYELILKGVDRELAGEILEPFADQDEKIKRLAFKRGGNLEDSARRKIIDGLMRQGYSYGEIAQALNELVEDGEFLG